MRYIAAAMTLLGLAACAAPQYEVALNDNLLAGPRGGETLNERIIREGQGDGCLVAGNAGRGRENGGSDRCRELRELVAPPPPPPPGMELAPPPVMPAPPQ